MRKVRVRSRPASGGERVKDLPGLVTFCLVLYALGALWLLSTVFQQPQFPWLHVTGTIVLGTLAAGMTFRQNWARALSTLFWLGVMLYGIYALFVPPHGWVAVLMKIGLAVIGLYVATGMISVDVLRSFGVERHWMYDLTAMRQDVGKKS